MKFHVHVTWYALLYWLPFPALHSFNHLNPLCCVTIVFFFFFLQTSAYKFHIIPLISLIYRLLSSARADHLKFYLELVYCLHISFQNQKNCLACQTQVLVCARWNLQILLCPSIVIRMGFAQSLFCLYGNDSSGGHIKIVLRTIYWSQ